MKQTAVDWLFQELWDRPKDKMVWYYILEKAKEMEKEQIAKAFDLGLCDGWDHGNIDDYYVYKDGEDFYEKNYGKDG